MKQESLKYIKAILNIVLTAVAILLVVWLVPKVLLYFLPFVIGWIIACIARPMVKFFEEKLKIKRKAGSAVVIVVVIGLVILALYLAGAKIVHESINFIGDLPGMMDSAKQDFEDIQKNLAGLIDMIPGNIKATILTLGQSASDMVGDFIGRLGEPTFEALGDFAKQIPTVIIGGILGLLSSYFFVAERESWFEPVKRRMPKSFLSRWNLVKSSIKKSVGGYLKAQLKIEIWIYLLVVIGLLILQVDYALLVALGIAFLDFFPFFGTGTVMVPWAIIKFLSADYGMTIGLLVVWGIGQLVRQIIQPKIMGDSMGMAPIPTLFLLYIGYRVGGVIGMILALPIGIIVETMWKEGVFDTTKKSVKILWAGVNCFRRITDEDMKEAEEYQAEVNKEAKDEKL